MDFCWVLVVKVARFWLACGWWLAGGFGGFGGFWLLCGFWLWLFSFVSLSLSFFFPVALIPSSLHSCAHAVIHSLI